MRRLLALAWTAALGCGGPAAKTPDAAGDAGLPRLSTIVREGDPAAVLGVFVSTEGIEPDAGGAAAVALAGILEWRLAKAGLDARVFAQQNGVRADIVFSQDRGANVVDALRRALLDAVGPTDPALEGARRKLEALARIPPQNDPSAACSAELSPGGRKLASIDGVRAAIGLGRVALAVVGGPQAAETARAGLRAGKRWPAASAIPARTPVPGFVEQSGTRARVIAHTGAASAAASAAALGKRNSIAMTLHGGDGCIRIDTDADAGAVALTKRMLADSIRASQDASFDAQASRAVREADDARDAADRAAVWAFAASRRGDPTPLQVSVIGPADLERALARAEADLASPVLETRTRTEPGQGSVWVLLASPCGTESEGVADAGVSALFAAAAADRGALSGEESVELEPWIAPDGIGVLAHAVRPVTDARVGEIVARAIFQAELDGALPKARAALLRSVQPALAALAAAIAPGHPSWVVAGGTPDALLRVADSAVTTRATSLRAGPWRAAIVTDDRSTNAAAAIDRWIPRGSSARTCPTAAPRSAAAPGMIAATAPASAAYLAFPLEAQSSIATAPWFAAALDGKGGLLDRTLVQNGMVRSASAHVVGAPRAPALAIFLEAPGSALDAAVLQTRTLFERIRKSGLAADDAARARTTHDAGVLHASLDPRARALALWRGTPPPVAPDAAAMQSAAADTFRDDALVVVAARPRGDR